MVLFLAAKDMKLSTHQRVVLNLITEQSFFLQQALWYDEMKNFAAIVETGAYTYIHAHHDAYSTHNAMQCNVGGYTSGYTVDAFETMKIKSHLHDANYEQAIDSLKSNCFPTYAKVGRCPLPLPPLVY